METINQTWEDKKRTIIANIEAKFMDLETEEKQHVADLLDFHASEPATAAKRIADYLSKSTPVNVMPDFIYQFL